MSGRESSPTGERAVPNEELDRVLRALDLAEERLRDMERQLEQAERLATMGTLVGVVAHEFNNLLTPIMSYAQLAMSAPADEQLTRKALERAYKGAERASRVASSMLGFGKGIDEPAACLVREALREAVDTTRLNARHEHIELTVDIEDGLCAAITPLSLQQVFVNLLLNARKAMGQERGGITVEGRRSTWNTDDRPTHALHDDKSCEVIVRDTGPGIPADIMRTLFTPYRSGDRRRPGGTGLGLTICKRLIESAHGTISVVSTPGEGAAITITLPAGATSLLETREHPSSAA